MRITFIFILLFYINGVLAEIPRQSFSFGVVPQHNALRSAARWQPLLAYVSEKTGYHLQFASESNISDFIQVFLDGEYDFAYVNPYSYVQGHDKEGYYAFGKESQRFLQAIFVVHKDSPIKSIYELHGKKVAFPSIDAFAAHILLKAYLEQFNIQVESAYLGSHDQSYLSVYNKEYVAGGGIIRTFQGISEHSMLRKNLKILWKANKSTGHALTVHPRVPHEAVNKILTVMQTLSNDAQGQHLLAQVKLNGIAAAEDAEWDTIRQLCSSQ